MIKEFDFIRPADLDEALGILAAGDEAFKPLAGGTDIVPGLQQGSHRFAGIKKLVDIHHLPELNTVRETETGISIGAAVSFTAIQHNPLIREHFPLLAKAVSTIGSVQIRNRATIAGNFVNNAPCADSVPPLLVYDAEIRIRSAGHERKLRLEEFLVKPYRTQLQPDELVTEILLPAPPAGYRGDFYKLGRRRGVAISRITLALLLKMQQETIEDIRIAAGAVTPIGKRFPGLEDFAKGKKTTSDFLKELAQKLGQKVLDTTGLRWSTPYKLPVTQQMFYQLLQGICS